MTDFITHPLTQLFFNPLAGYSGVNAVAILTLAMFAGLIVGAIIEWRRG